MNFFVVANGRSGTLWLARLLNQSPTHRVRHEEADTHRPVSPECWEPFPIDRWADGNYGECHGILRRYLSPAYEGEEYRIPGKYVLLRSKKAIFESWMNRGGHRANDAGWRACSICKIEKNLLALHRSRGFKMLVMEDLTTNLPLLQGLVDELGLGFTVSQELQTTKVNIGKKEFKWTPHIENVYNRMVIKFGDKGGLP